MPESPSAHLHFDFPGPDRILPIGRSSIRGWMAPKPGWHYTDLRLRIEGEILPGIHGLLRRDVAAFLKADDSLPLAGFEIAVDLPAGHHRLILEACSITGAWEALETLEVEATSVGETEPAPKIVPLRSREFGEALWVLLRRIQAGGRLAELAEAVAAATPSPHYLRHPHLPFLGHLDEPQAWSRSVFGRIPISGWLVHPTLAIKRVFATTDLQAVEDLRFGRETPFLAALHPNLPQSLRCGFDGFLDLPAQLPQPVTVRVYAELEDGSWHLGSVARIATTDHEFAKQPLPRFSPVTFWRAWRSLRSALARRGTVVETGRAYLPEVAKLWRAYAAQAPRSAPFNIRSTRAILANPGPEKISRVHYCIHNLSHQGAPLFLLEHARHLQLATGAGLTVTSAQDGPLRRDFEALGATVRVIDDTPLLACANDRQFSRALGDLAAAVNLSPANLVVANTLSCYWAVHLAHRAGRPALYYIHESTAPRVFYRGLLPPRALAMVEASFRLADRVSFLTDTSRRYYDAFSDQSNYCLHPGWIDLAGIDHFRANHSRATQRQCLGFSAEKKLVVNVGTVCDRKGQHLFARAVDLLWRRAPALASAAEFLMVGGGDTAYDASLANLLRGLNRPNLRIVPGTGQVYPYYQAADLFVCSSYEESFPRVILEAMAFEVPIVSTGVHGIPEMVRPNLEALLVPPGDSAALSAAMQRLLESPETGRALARQARVRVADEFDSRVVLPRHAALARALAATQ